MAPKKKPKAAPVEEDVIVAAHPKPLSVKGIGVPINYDDKKNWCPNNEFCGAEHKGPMLHLIRTGHCGIGCPDWSHRNCIGVFATAGKRKVVTCKCECHRPAPRKLKKMAHHE